MLCQTANTDAGGWSGVEWLTHDLMRRYVDSKTALHLLGRYAEVTPKE